MPAVTLKAHYDGERIVLDEPFEIPPNSDLMVTVLPPTETVADEDWFRIGRKALSAAYGTDEPDYGIEDLRQ
ncbi:MAG: hypothetical protein RDU20_18315 [Desulfomonilaceae bacterium]|nr:hypothetical protein [Desulfomonilaceae bacterium]